MTGNSFFDGHFRVGTTVFPNNFIVTGNGRIGIGTDSPDVIVHINGTDALKIPVGDDTQRPTADNAGHRGYIRYNTTTSQFEGFGAGNAWGSLGGVIDVDQDTLVSAEDAAGDSNNEIKFYTSAAPNATHSNHRMIIGSSGLLGIGSGLVSPNSLVHVSGNVGSRLLQVGDAVQPNIMKIEDSNIALIGDLTVTGNSFFDGTVTVNGHLVPNRTLTYTLGTTENRWQDLYVSTGSIHMGDLKISYDSDTKTVKFSNLDGDNEQVNIDTGSDITDFEGSINVDQNARIGGTLGVTGNTTIDGTLDVNGTLEVSGVDIEENLNIGGTLGVTGNTTVDGRLDVNNEADISDTLTLSKISGTGLSVVSDATVGGDLVVTGNTIIDGITTITNSTDSTNKDTGALIVEGGVGIEENLNVSGNLKIGESKLYINDTQVTATAAELNLLHGVSSAAVGFLTDFGTASLPNMNTVDNTSGRYRWSGTTNGRPDINGSSNEYGTVLHLEYVSSGGATLGSQLAWDIAGNNLFIRTLDGDTNSGTEWWKLWHHGNDGSGSTLDADLLDGANASDAASNSTIVKRNVSGYIYANYFNTTPNDVTSGVTKVLVETGNDGFMRHGTAASIRSFINVEDGATAGGTYQSAAELLTAIKTVDGTGTDLNADKLDGHEGAYYLQELGIVGNTITLTGGNAITVPFATNAGKLDDIESGNFLRSDVSDTFTGTLIGPESNTASIIVKNHSYSANELHIGGWSNTTEAHISKIRMSNHNLHIDSADGGGVHLNNYSTGPVYIHGNEVWHAGNLTDAVIKNAVEDASNSNIFTDAYQGKLDGITTGANNYELPAANLSQLGGVKVGSGLNITTGGLLSVGSISAEALAGVEAHGGSNGKFLRMTSSGMQWYAVDSSPWSQSGTTLTYDGKIIVDEIDIGGADLAEKFAVSDADNDIEPGMVLVIDHNKVGHLTVSTEPYDKKVAGIISGANGIKAGVILQQDDALGHGDNLVALAGRVWVKASDENGVIEPGDMLTTSSTRGHAMKVTEYDRARGAIIGKAMSTIESGFVLILIQNM